MGDCRNSKKCQYFSQQQISSPITLQARGRNFTQICQSDWKEWAAWQLLGCQIVNAVTNSANNDDTQGFHWGNKICTHSWALYLEPPFLMNVTLSEWELVICKEVVPWTNWKSKLLELLENSSFISWVFSEQCGIPGPGNTAPLNLVSRTLVICDKSHVTIVT